MKTDVVFVHGWPLSSATWRHVIPRMSDRFNCHAIDLPVDGEVSIPGHARSVRRYVDQLGLKQYALVGHDSGGFIARIVAAEDPRVTRLVLGNTEIPGHTPFMLAAFVALHRLGLLRPAFSLVLRSPRLLQSPLGFGNCFTDPAYAMGEFYDAQIRPAANSLDGQLKLLDSLDAHTMAGLKAIHARITCPTAFVWGTDDPWFPLEKMRPMTAQFGGPTHIFEIAKGKLFAHEDHAAAFADATISHLSQPDNLAGLASATNM